MTMLQGVLSDDDLMERVLTALSRANTDFARASRGWWATDFGVECLLQTRIFDTLAEAVADHRDIAVVMERQMAMGGTTRGRADVALECEDGSEVLPIEVKLHWKEETAGQDVHRLLSWIKDRADIQCGIFACLLHCNPRARRHASLEEVRQAFQQTMVSAARDADVPVRCAYGVIESPGHTEAWARHRSSDKHYDLWLLRPAVALFRKATDLPA